MSKGDGVKILFPVGGKMIRIGNIKNGSKGEYCGRKCYGRSGSPLGNPFPMRTEGDRDKSCSDYENWFNECIRNKVPEILEEIERLLELAKRGDLTLLCWCAPKRCHCLTIKKYLESKLHDQL